METLPLPFTDEQWCPVVGYEDLYEVSNLGRVRGLVAWSRWLAGRIRKPSRLKTGRLTIHLRTANHDKTVSLPVIVAAAFLGPRPPGMEINHLDGDFLNNRADNLEYTTPQGNKDHAKRLGLTAHGERNANAKLSDDLVRTIRQRYVRGKTGCGYLSLSREFGVSRIVISRIVRGVAWHRVT